MSWNDLFVNMDNTNFFNFSFLPKYGSAFVRGFEYTLLLAVVSVLLAVIPALLLAMMRLSKIKPIKWFAGAYIAVFRSTPMLVQLSIIYFGLFHYISLPTVVRLHRHQPLYPRRGRFGAEQLGVCSRDIPRWYTGRGQGADRGRPFPGPVLLAVHAFGGAAPGHQERPPRPGQ